MCDSSNGKMGCDVPRPVFSGHFFLLHSPILKPYFHLAVSEVYTPTDLQAALASQVHIEEEFFLQLQSLVFGVRTPLLSPGFRTQPAASSVLEFLVFCLCVLSRCFFSLGIICEWVVSS